MENNNFWIARDLDGSLWLMECKPVRDMKKNIWEIPTVELVPNLMRLPSNLFPEVTWENEPVLVNIKIC